MSTSTVRQSRLAQPDISAGNLPTSRLHDEIGFRSGIANEAIVVAVLADVVRLRPVPAYGVVRTTGLAGWAMFTGFAENRFSVLACGDGDLLRVGPVLAVVRTLGTFVRWQR